VLNVRDTPSSDLDATPILKGHAIELARHVLESGRQSGHRSRGGDGVNDLVQLSRNVCRGVDHAGLAVETDLAACVRGRNEQVGLPHFGHGVAEQEADHERAIIRCRFRSLDGLSRRLGFERRQQFMWNPHLGTSRSER